MNKKIIFLILVFVLIVSFVVAEEVENSDTGEELEVVEYNDMFGEDFEGDVSGQGLETKEIGETNSFTFEEEDANLKVGDDEFKNIKEGTGSYIHLDETGVITQAEFITNDGGGTYSLGGTTFDVPPNSKVEYDKEKGILNFPDGGEIKKFPKAESKEEGLEIPKFEQLQIKGKDIKLPEGHVLNSGTLNYDGEKLFIDGGKETVIDDLKINSKDSTDIYFDGKEHEGNIISFGEKNLIIQGEQEIKFLKNNPYIKIEEGDSVNMQPYYGSSIKIQNRDAQGLIPKVMTKGGFFIEEDSKRIDVINDKVYISKGTWSTSQTKSTTSPIELSLLDRQGSPFLGKTFTGESLKENKIFIDNFNRIVIVQENSEEALAKSEGIDTTFSSKIKYNYVTEEELESLTGKEFELIGLTKGEKQLGLGRFRDYYNNLNEETKSSFKKISFLDEKGYAKNSPCGLESSACASSGKEMFFKTTEHSLSLSTFRHESAHERHFSLGGKGLNIDSEEYERYSKLENLQKEKYKEYNKIYSSGGQQKILDKLKKDIDLIDGQKQRIFEGQEKEFEADWYEIAGGEEFYEKTSAIHSSMGSLGYLYKEFKDMPLEEIYKQSREEIFGPKYGLTRPYGGANILEDVATFVEEVNNPKIFAPLINPESPKYDIRYRQKLALLHEYKFITNDEYNKILNVAGVK